MSTKYRKQSDADLYHVTIRGVAKQIIFEDDEDRRFFGKRMRLLLAECDVKLYAWCFMSNHVHLLLKSGIGNVTAFMRKLQTSYAMYFNKRHDRTGHLFQHRFDSVPIETDEQLLTTVRYIHRNPEDIPGQEFDAYEWSSYREYLNHPFISETAFVMTVFGSRDAFILFHHSWAPDSREARDIHPTCKAVSDKEAIELAKDLLGVGSISAIASFDKQERNRCLTTLKRNGLPIAQIARITGIGRNIVQRAKQ